MKKLMSFFKRKELLLGYLYFYIHFIVEVVCFFYLSRVSNSPIIWLIPFLYDAFAFVPQSLIGYLNDKYPKIKIDYIGIALLFFGILIISFLSCSRFISLFLICLGNACLHIGGARGTLLNSNGLLSPVSIFVSGGSFGVITGRLLANTPLSSWILLPLILTIIPFVIYKDRFKIGCSCDNFNYVKKNISPILCILIAFFVVVIRGYMGYGIPTSWNKTVIENVMLFCFMGLGKALGGILSDIYGIRKVAIISTIFSIPLLSFGNNIMIISLIGVMMFSMTMSITLGILVSILKKTPGLAFGITTIGLFLGTVPIFFFQIINIYINIVMIVVLSLLCAYLLSYVLERRNNDV